MRFTLALVLFMACGTFAALNFDCALAPECFVDPCQNVDSPKCSGACLSDCNCNPVCACETNDDCGEKAFCREVPPTFWDAKRSVCVPFAQEGESCGGYVAPYARNECASNLICVNSPIQEATVSDLPGVCRKPCSSNDDCPWMPDGPVVMGTLPIYTSTYCSSQGVCLHEGGCSRYEDCVNPANTYPSVMCIGLPYCSTDGKCSVDCGANYNECREGVRCPSPEYACLAHDCVLQAECSTCPEDTKPSMEPAVCPNGSTMELKCMLRSDKSCEWRMMPCGWQPMSGWSQQ